MSSKNKNAGFNVICDEKSGRILDMPPVNDDDKITTEAVDDSEHGKSQKHHLSNSGTKRPGYRK